MALIDIQDVSFRYGEEYIFKNMSVQLDSTWKLGLIGRNGRGKSTFLKLLMGEYAYHGHIQMQESCMYFPFPIVNDMLLSIQIVEEILPYYEHWKLQRECQLLQLEEAVLYRPFSTLSKGEQTKLLLAILFLHEDCFLLIDEPTNHLDVEGRQVVSAYLKKKQGFILVSHDRTFIDDCVDHIMAINAYSLDIQKGNFTSWYTNKEQEDMMHVRKNQKLLREIKEMEVAKNRVSQWSDKVESTKTGTRVAGLKPDRGRIGHKAAKMMQRSKNIENRMTKNQEEKKGLLKNIESIEDITLPYIHYKKDILVQLEDVAVYYDGTAICKDVSLVIKQGDRFVIKGRNGSGKSSILKVVMGDLLPTVGSRTGGQDLKISYVKQEIEDVQGSLDTYINNQNIDATMCKMWLRKMDFSRMLFHVPMDKYSDGQKKKVLLASALCKPAHLYIFDEALNYIDIFSRIQIENMLKATKATILFVEHDEAFIKSIQTNSYQM